MKELVLASNNLHKIEEIRSILTDYKILSLNDIGFNFEIDEDQDTFEGNAEKKAYTIYKYCNKPTIADDSGLCVDKLSGEPGVYSARYSSTGKDYDNIQKVLKKLSGEESTARFVSVISYVNQNGEVFNFRGEIEGKIITELRGNNGFGYDPIFYVEDYKKTLAELTSEEKNKISHRNRALQKFYDYLKEI